MERYDLAIIGTGPAGLSAALTARNRNLNFVLFGNRGLSEKIGKTHKITNFLGLPDITGEDLKKTLLAQMDQDQIPIREERVGTVYSMGDYFALQVGQEMVEASTVILAVGVVSAKPYPGEQRFFGNGVSYCATCDGMLYKDRPVAVIAGSAREEAEADFLAGICRSVDYFPLYREEPSVSEKVTVRHEKPLEIAENVSGGPRLLLKTDSTMMSTGTLAGEEKKQNSPRAETAKTGELSAEMEKTGYNEYPVDCVFILRDSVAPSSLVPGLAVDKGKVIVNRMMETNLPGLFAAGDITGTPYQYMKAAGEGNVAALSAAAYLTEMKRRKTRPGKLTV